MPRRKRAAFFRTDRKETEVHFPVHARSLLLAAASVAILATPAKADTYPSRPIRIIVATGAGGATDVIARLFGERLRQRLDQPVVVENRTGAGNVVGTAYASKAPKDGYTLLMGSSAGLSVQPVFESNLPYDAQRDFQPIALIAISRLILATSSALPVRNLTEFIEHAKAHPNTLSYATPGSGTPHHLAGEALKLAAGIDMQMVPYRGMALANIDVASGRVPVVVDNLSNALPSIRSGKQRAIALMSDERTELAPDIPTFAESGMPGFEYRSWIGLLAPSGTPSDAVRILSDSIREIASNASLQQELRTAGFEVRYLPPEPFAALMRDEIARYRDIVQRARLRAAGKD